LAIDHISVACLSPPSTKQKKPVTFFMSSGYRFRNLRSISGDRLIFVAGDLRTPFDRRQILVKTPTAHEF